VSAIAAVLTLSLTIGAGASIFAVVDAILLTPPPFADPDALVTLGETSIGAPSSASRAVLYATFQGVARSWPPIRPSLDGSSFSAMGSGVLIQHAPNAQNATGTITSRRMEDGKEWTTTNLNVNVSPSYCYADAESNCRRYGRLYTWESAQRVCPSLGDGWRLPTDDEWRQMAKRYGGVIDDSTDKGKAAFIALLSGGAAGFNAVLAGNRSGGHYERLEEHGFYWTASDNGSGSAPFYNFGKDGQALNRQPQGEKAMAISVRCVRQ